MNSGAKDLWYPRAVFFVKDAERSLSFYTEKLGSTLDWNYEQDGQPFVFQVNLNGVELIVNQVDGRTDARAGHGRIFVGLEDDQVEGFWRHLEKHAIERSVVLWGAPTIAVYDLDGNELFFWLSETEREKLRTELIAPGQEDGRRAQGPHN